MKNTFSRNLVVYVAELTSRESEYFCFGKLISRIDLGLPAGISSGRYFNDVCQERHLLSRLVSNGFSLVAGLYKEI